MTRKKTLDEIIDSSARETVEASMKIARREWENIRASLKLCGDTGEFSPADFMVGVITDDVIIRKPLQCATKSVDTDSPTYYPMYLVKNLAEMDALMAGRGYGTTQALYCHIELAAAAVSNLGLSGIFAMGFACGYGTARTGWIAEKGLRRERDFFLEKFFGKPLFGKVRINNKWNFRWHSTQVKLKEIFDRFSLWQKNGELHKTETAEERKIKPLLV